MPGCSRQDQGNSRGRFFWLRLHGYPSEAEQDKQALPGRPNTNCRNGRSALPSRSCKAPAGGRPPPRNEPLFNIGTLPLTRTALVRILNTHLTVAGVVLTTYNGHSFLKGAVQCAMDHGCNETELKLLGRWTSAACRLYYKTVQADIYFGSMPESNTALTRVLLRSRRLQIDGREDHLRSDGQALIRQAKLCPVFDNVQGDSGTTRLRNPQGKTAHITGFLVPCRP